MELSRREFLKLSGAGAGVAVLLKGLDTSNKVKAAGAPLKKRIGEKTTICPYDGSGCGFIVAAQDGKVVNIEGDPDHPRSIVAPLVPRVPPYASYQPITRAVSVTSCTGVPAAPTGSRNRGTGQ